MPNFHPDELAQWVSRSWKNGIPKGVITGVSHDTRSLKPGNLYIAIEGDQFDGHKFVEAAFEKGAAGALVKDGFACDKHPVIPVSDTLKGLQDLARGYRKKWTILPIGITGSVGKTTVKEMCADVLSVHGHTHRTAGNYNNHIGLPLTMLAMPETTTHGVFEIGMNQPCEIASLSDLLEPQIGILTDIGNAHRERFDSLESIAREKMKLAESVPESGLVILDRDAEWYDLFREHVRANVVTVSYGGAADYSGINRDGQLEVNGQLYTMPLPGEHIMRNALRAIALGLEIGLSPEQVADGLSRFKSTPMRWQESTVNGIHFINDAYNANPLSMRASLSTFAEITDAGKKWVVVGGMRELGDTEEAEHRALGEYIDTFDFDGVITVGVLGRGISCTANRPFHQVENAAEAADILRSNLAEGDRVLLKASRGERLETVLNYFKEK